MVTEITKWGYPDPTPFVPALHMVERGTLKDSLAVAGGEDHGEDHTERGPGEPTVPSRVAAQAAARRLPLKRQRVRQFTHTCRVALKDSLTVAGSPADIPGPIIPRPPSPHGGEGDPKGLPRGRRGSGRTWRGDPNGLPHGRRG